MHTEEEAKKKWCPTLGLMHAIGNENPVPLCFASDCMMWRWVESKPTELKGRCGLAGRTD